MRKRSEAVLAVAKMRAVAAASTAEMDALPDKARKEAERQKLIAAKRKAEACEDGLLLPAETTQDFSTAPCSGGNEHTEANCCMGPDILAQACALSRLRGTDFAEAPQTSGRLSGE